MALPSGTASRPTLPRALPGAGEERLRQLDSETLPSLARQVEAGGDVVKAQELGDLRARRDELERREHDLRLTRQITMQSLPSIRIEVVPGAGHAVQSDQPAALVALLNDFVPS